MLCQKCGKNEATTHYKQIINGKKTEMHLCSECAAKMNIAGTFPSLLSDMFFGEDFGLIDQACSQCGTTLSQIKNYGKVGCGNCYDTFMDALLPYITKIHGADEHISEVDRILAEGAKKELKEEKTAETKKDSESEKLQKQLKEAIKNENYEEAAIIRDKIKALKEDK